jgi:hypothetical protein
MFYANENGDHPDSIAPSKSVVAFKLPRKTRFRSISVLCSLSVLRKVDK